MELINDPASKVGIDGRGNTWYSKMYVAVGLVRRLLVVGEQLRNEQARARYTALEHVRSPVVRYIRLPRKDDVILAGLFFAAYMRLTWWFRSGIASML